MNFNRVIIGGRLTRDPELKQVGAKGTSVANLGLAVNRVRGTGSERQEEVCFVDATAWGKQAEVITKYLSKGDQILIEGRLSYESWDAQDGTKRSKLKVTVEKFEFVGGGKKEEQKVDF
jgi:single-strand DNA-binding protein